MRPVPAVALSVVVVVVALLLPEVDGVVVDGVVVVVVLVDGEVDVVPLLVVPVVLLVPLPLVLGVVVVVLVEPLVLGVVLVVPLPDIVPVVDEVLPGWPLAVPEGVVCCVVVGPGPCARCCPAGACGARSRCPAGLRKRIAGCGYHGQRSSNGGQAFRKLAHG